MINYYLITKPGIIFGNLITLAAGFLLASKGQVDLWLFLETLFGLTFIMASACVFNNYIDRNIDRKMERTKSRALVIGLIPLHYALIYGTFLGVAGGLILMTFTNWLTLAVAAFGFLVYVIIYSLWKSRTIYGTAIGSVAGAVPPIVGYCAVSNQLDMGALILFLMLVLWQMPHFYAIAMYHYEDYRRAKLPVLTHIKGMRVAKIHMIAYIVCFMIVSSLLTYFDYTGYIYLTVTLLLSIIWLTLGIRGFSHNNFPLWGKQMFQFSLVLITTLSIVMSLDVT